MPPEANRREDQYEFARRYETYLDAVYGGTRGRAQLCESVAQTILDRKERLGSSEQFRVFDCAAGTGFPALDLRWHPGFAKIPIRCSDMDRPMLNGLLDRARETEADFRINDLAPRISGRQPLEDLNHLVLKWSELGRLRGRYDYVMCRGNSLAYADTWGGGRQVAGGRRLVGLLEKICDRVRPGGWLHIDAPRELQFGHRGYPEVTFNGQPCSITEQVEAVRDARLWKVRFAVGDETREFERYSSNLTIDQVEHLLRHRLGFKETHTVQLDGERPNFGVIIAQRPM